MNGITVTIRSFEAYKGRKDVSHNSWFRCSNRFLEDPDFFDFTPIEKLVWIYILSLSSQKNSAEVFINFDHADRVCGLKKRDVVNAIEKLSGKQLLPADVTPTLRSRNADVTETCATNRQTDKHTHTSTPPRASAGMHWLGELWNSKVTNFSRVKKTADKRLTLCQKVSDDFSAEEWAAIFARADKSNFLTGGGSTGWVAGFDWVLKNASRIDEGEFDGRQKTAASSGDVCGVADV